MNDHVLPVVLSAILLEPPQGCLNGGNLSVEGGLLIAEWAMTGPAPSSSLMISHPSPADCLKIRQSTHGRLPRRLVGVKPRLRRGKVLSVPGLL
jgi:hypothetical protein